MLPKFENESMATRGSWLKRQRLFGSHDGDFGQILGGRLDIYGGIGQEIDAALGRDQHIDAGHDAQFGPPAITCNAGRMVSG